MAQHSDLNDTAAHGEGATFDVVLTGVRVGVPLSEATASLAALFKATPAQIAGLLDDRSHVVKQGCTPALAAVYRDAIEKAGGSCELVERARTTLTVDASLFREPPATEATAVRARTALPTSPERLARQIDAPVASQRQQTAARAFCFKCGTGLASNAAFCANCGAPQAVATVPVTEESTRASMGGATSNGIALRPEETILFEGDVVLLKSKISVSQTDAVITNQRLFVTEGSLVVEKGDVESVTEEKHGLDVKMVFKLRDGRVIAMTAANRQMFVAAAKILTGQAEMSAMPKQPELSSVKNGTAWLAAFGPIISTFVAVFLGTMLWGNMDQWRTSQIWQGAILRVALIYVFLRIDYLKLQSQGYNVKQLGLSDPITFPIYLFSRAKVFNNGSGPAVTWCVLVAIDLLLMLNSL